MAHNSTIRVKQKVCKSCGRLSYIFSKGRCANCSRVEDFNKREEKETLKTEDLRGLIEDADALVSRYVRMSAMNKEGLIKCFTCNKLHTYAETDCGHYISRSNMYLRFDLRNMRPQCHVCNRSKYGMAAVFSTRLEDQNPGIVDILYEESKVVYRIGREELRAIISEFTEKLKHLKNGK